MKVLATVVDTATLVLPLRQCNGFRMRRKLVPLSVCRVCAWPSADLNSWIAVCSTALSHFGGSISNGLTAEDVSVRASTARCACLHRGRYCAAPRPCRCITARVHPTYACSCSIENSKSSPPVHQVRPSLAILALRPLQHLQVVDGAAGGIDGVQDRFAVCVNWGRLQLRFLASGCGIRSAHWYLPASRSFTSHRNIVAREAAMTWARSA